MSKPPLSVTETLIYIGLMLVVLLLEVDGFSLMKAIILAW